MLEKQLKRKFTAGGTKSMGEMSVCHDVDRAAINIADEEDGSMSGIPPYSVYHVINA